MGQPYEQPDVGRRDGKAAIDPRTLLRRSGRRKPRLKRTALRAAAFAISILCVGLIAGGLFFARLAQGPIALDIKPQIMAALNKHVGHGYTFDLAATSVEATDHGPALTISEFVVLDAAHRPVVTAPKAAISVDPLSLMMGKIAPSRLEIRDLDLHLLLLQDGQVAVSAGSGQAAALPLIGALPAGPRSKREVAPVDAAGPQPGNEVLRGLATALRSLIDATTGTDGPAGTIERVGITGRLVLEDRTRGTTRIFSNTELNFDRTSDGAALLSIAADGPNGRWSVAARAVRGEDAGKSLTIEARDLSFDEIALAGGWRGLDFDVAVPASASLGFHLAPDGSLDVAKGRFSLGSGYFKLDDPDHEPLLIDSVSGGFHLGPGNDRVEIEPTVLHAGESVFTLTGSVALPPKPGEAWTVAAEASGIFGTERPGEKPIKIAHAELALRALPDDRRLLIDRVVVSGPEVAFEMNGDMHGEGQGFRFKSTSSVKHMPAQALARLWPSFIAAPVRAWFLANLRGGVVDQGTATVNLTDQDLALMRVQRSVPDDHVHVDFAVSDLSLAFMPGVPPVANLDGAGTVTGHVVDFDATHGEMELGSGRKLSLADGNFHVPDSDPKPTPAVIVAHVVGALESVTDLLSRDALRPFANLPVDAANVKGQVDSHVTVALKLGDGVPAEDIKVSATATATGFAAEKLIGKEGLVDTTLALSAENGGFRAKGDGRMFGAPATIEIKKPSGSGAGEAVITLALDEAARAKAGINVGKSVTGTVAARVTTGVGPGDKGKATVELDFAKAGIDGLLPGFTKPSGRPGKATMTVTQHDNGISLDGIVFEGGGAALRGSAELDGKGGFVSAKMSQVRMSPGDDIKVDAAQSGDGLKLVARGANLDARPFLKWLATSGPGTVPEGGGEAAKNLDLELHANVLTGQNSQAMTGTDLRVSRRGGQVRRLQLSGRFGRQPITIATVGQNGAPHFVVTSSDAGASLAFLDLYKRMTGGRLEANLLLTGERLDGTTVIRDFTLREDPAIKKLATEGLASQARGTEAKIDTSSVPFTKLEASFTRIGSKVDIHEGAFYGPEVGATVEGTLDFAHDQVNVSGTFVPIYGVNNLFSQVPLFGPMLGGGPREGLFGLNYRITGPASAPILSVNPLSAIAPGFLRKIFGTIDSAAQGEPTPRPGTAAPAPDPAPSDPE